MKSKYTVVECVKGPEFNFVLAQNPDAEDAHSLFRESPDGRREEIFHCRTEKGTLLELRQISKSIAHIVEKENGGPLFELGITTGQLRPLI